MRDNRTGQQRRADNRAAIADVADAAVRSDRCDRSARAIWAARLDVSHQHIDDVLAGRKALHADVLAEAPVAVLEDVVQHLLGDSRVVIDVPTHGTADDFALLAKLVREQNATLEALIAASADGNVSADEGARIERAAHRSMQVTAAVRELGRRAVAQRGLSLVPRRIA